MFGELRAKANQVLRAESIIRSMKVFKELQLGTKAKKKETETRESLEMANDYECSFNERPIGFHSIHECNEGEERTLMYAN